MIKTLPPGCAFRKSAARPRAIAPAAQPSSVNGMRRTLERKPIKLMRWASSEGIMKPAQGAEIVENAAALVHVQFELFHAVEGGAQGVQAARGLRSGFPLDVGFNLTFGFTNGCRQQCDELVGALDAVEGTSGFVSHGESPFVFRRVRASAENSSIALNPDFYRENLPVRVVLGWRVSQGSLG